MVYTKCVLKMSGSQHNHDVAQTFKASRERLELANSLLSAQLTNRKFPLFFIEEILVY